ncbi:MAG: hypothetical protein ACLFST_03665 [Spirochaetia bacterium]
MVALLVGIVFVLFSVYSVLDVQWSLQWWDEVLIFLKGGIPIIALLIGLIAIFIGIADLKDKMEAKKEEAAERAEEENNSTQS